MTPTKSKGGRPALGARKLVVITVRVTPEQAAKWRRTANKAARFRDWLARLPEDKA